MAFCKIHGEYDEAFRKVFGRQLPVGCPKCRSELEQLVNEQDALQTEAIEAETAQETREQLIKRGIEPEFFGVTLADYKPETEDEQRALDAAKALLEGKIQKLILLGSFGTGKTMLASVLAMLLDGVRITMFELSARIRATYNGSGETDFDVLNSLLEYQFIAIDEIGRTKGSEAELNWLSYLIDKAHTRGIRLMLISNRRRMKNLPQERRNECFEMFLPNDSISRLKQNSVIVELTGRDRRGDFNAVF